MLLRRATGLLLVGALLLLPVSSALADVVISPPAPGLQAKVAAEGLLEYETGLEAPHFVVDGWALIYNAPTVLQRLTGKQVKVIGTEFTGVSYLMRRQLVVETLETTLEGELTYVSDLETPHYTLEGWVVKGAEAELMALAGQKVRLTATVTTEPSVYNRPVLQVKTLSRIEPGVPRLPWVFAVGDQIPLFPVRAFLQDGQIMIPLRPVIEAAGGTVTWHPERREALVMLSGRTTTIAVGVPAALGQAPPMLIQGHLVVPMATLKPLGLQPRWVWQAILLEEAPASGSAEM